MATVEFLFLKLTRSTRFYNIINCKTCEWLVFLDELIEHSICNYSNLKEHDHYLYVSGCSRYKNKE